MPGRAIGSSRRRGLPTVPPSSSIAALYRMANRTQKRAPRAKLPRRLRLSAPCAGLIRGTGSRRAMIRRVISGSLDPAAIAAAKGLGAVAPFYVEQESPMPPGGLPQPGRLVVSLPDNHLQYALTWFGLAGVLAGVFVSWAVTSSRRHGDEEAGEAGC